MQTSCQNNILINNNQYNFCQKSKQLNNVKIENEMYFLQKSNSQLFINADNVQKSAIDVQIYNYAVNLFVLFGLSESQIVSDSSINVSLNFQVFQGALICIKCDVQIITCTLIFIAAGNQVSGILIETNTQIYIQQTFIQYRISSQYSSGIVNSVNTSDVNISIIDCKLIGFNLISSECSGYIATQLLQSTIITITQFYVCVDNISTFGNNSIITTYNGTINYKCDLCDMKYYVYGICSDSLKYGQELNHMLQCVYPFEYVNNQCVCSQGYVLDQQICVNIIQIINIALNLSQNNEQAEKITEFEKLVEQIDYCLSQNISQLQDQIYISENFVVSNFTELQKNLKSNTSTLENRILGNASLLENIIRVNFNALENYILQNVTVLDWRIYNNISALKTNISQNISQLLDQIYVSENFVVSNFTELQKNLKSNTSTLENRIIGNASLLENNIILNSSTLEKFILQNASVLDWRIYNNISALKTNISQIQVLHEQQIQQMQDTITNLVNQINCTNNAGYEYINGSCIQTSCSITGQERVNGICQCANANEIVESGSCVCPQNTTLVGQICTCPANSNFVSGVCTCNVIIGQTMVAGKCACPSGLTALNGICQLIINKLDGTFQCSQSVYVSTFEIDTITQSVGSGNFAAEYIFSTEIQDAFIDIADNVYTIVKPLFQSQSTFTNLKIQFGVQTVSGGSLIISSSDSIVINKMNIISKPNKQITLSASQLNILSNSPTGANINNLLVNLSFVSSSGNITLVSNINGVFNISGYQVLGDYTSTLVVAMIGLNIMTATIKVNQVSFKPNVYNVGNGSSYLFGSSISTVSTFVISNLAIVIGSSSSFVLLGSITTTISNQNQFGGIIAYINSVSPVNINNVILDSYQKFSTSYVSYSGFLIGYVQSSSSPVTIINVCLQQNMTSTTLQFGYFGLIGKICGNFSIQNTSITLSVQGSQFSDFGIVGVQNTNSLLAEVINMITSVCVNSISGGGNISSVFGREDAKNCSIQNTVIKGNIVSSSQRVSGIISCACEDSNVTIFNTSVSMIISGTYCVGGIIGSQQSNTTFKNCSVQNTNISGQVQIGGFIGCQYSNTTILNSFVSNTKVTGYYMLGGILGILNYNMMIMNSSVTYTNVTGQYQVGGVIGKCSSQLLLTNVIIQFVRLTSYSSYGVVVGGNAGGTYSFTNSTSISIFSEEVQLKDCAALSNSQLTTGC
ncbi:InlB_B-repeat-containing protein [Hexamita inflata]|uniref:InlB_B-repeat-containing protein n=1 Tax=Hexamita inflata TaxID=28002 RepID=A0ABP1GXF5_9EUKA